MGNPPWFPKRAGGEEANVLKNRWPMSPFVELDRWRARGARRKEGTAETGRAEECPRQRHQGWPWLGVGQC